MKRRSFLQGTGVFLTTWAASGQLVQRSQQVLAQPTSRKLALLVGINQYRNAGLNGCVTDVELQKELLINRFGFNPTDIITITDQQATRSQIETIFTEHLIKQAKPDDVVVFHFSGYGSVQKLGATADSIQPMLMTVEESESAIVNGISQDTLFLLLRSLATDQITTILDAGYTYPGYALLGHLRLRSRPSEAISALCNSVGTARLPDDEVAFQEALLSNLNLDRAQVRVQWRSEQIPGVVLAAATVQQFAAESPWNGFSAGLLTYALTQQLWQATPETTLRVSLRRAAEFISKRVDQKQQPILSGKKSRASAGVAQGTLRPLTPYHARLTEPPADGAITAIEDSGKIAQLWLGGLPPQVLEQYGTSSLFTVESSEQRPLLQLYDRNGLKAKARFVATDSTPMPTFTIGDRIQEAVRVLPRNIELNIAIDTTLERIERVDAVSAFSAMPHVSAVIAAEQAADYVFGKNQQPTQVATLTPIEGTIAPAGYGLFSQGRETIPNTIGDSGEAVKLAVRRLSPRLQTLLGAKLLSLTANEGSSQLGVRATLVTPKTQLQPQAASATPRRVRAASTPVVSSDGKLLTVSIGSQIQFNLENLSDQPIYFLVLGLDSSGSGFAFNNFGSSIQPKTVAASETATIPLVAPNSEWLASDAPGLAETYLICSRAPFQQARVLLSSSGASQPIKDVSNFLEVAQAVLQDLHQASSQVAQWVSAPDVLALDVNAWTTFRFLYQVV